MFRADLHCHTLYSDGTLTPQQLIVKAKTIGLCGLSITDHDSIKAYESAVSIAKEQDILLGTGAEFSCIFKGSNIHVLGYDFLIDSSAIKAFCAQHHQRRIERNRIILEKLRCFNMPLSENELNQMGHMIGRPHIAKLLVQKGYVGSIKEAFHLYIGDSKPCYHLGKGFSVEETIDVIHQAKGKAFIAHPHLLYRSSQIKALLALPFDGIECYYARFTLDQELRWIQIAKERNLLISGGSDYHGESLEHAVLGSSWVDQENFYKIFQNLL